MTRRAPHLMFEAVSIEGGLFTPDYLARVAALGAEHQKEKHYEVPRGITIRDEIGRAWRIAAAHWKDVEGSGNESAHMRAVLAVLTQAFGWHSLEPVDTPLAVGDRLFPLTALAAGEQVPVVVAPPGHDLDAGAAQFGDGRRRSPFGLVQEYLNATPQALWGVVTNGRLIRLVRDNASLTRPAWIEADLDRIMGEQRYADFSLLWLLLHQSRFAARSGLAHEAILERWREESVAAGVAARDKLRDGVEAALRTLGNGFLAHPANEALRQSLMHGVLDATGYHQQLLRLVYRIIFLLVAEERDLLHPPGSADDASRAYDEGYSLRRLREQAARRRAHDRHDDAWIGLRIVFRGCAAGEPLLALPALGGLFAADQCPDLDTARLGNAALFQTLFRLTWLEQNHARVRVNWRDMGTEEFGSVYESLLELVPRVDEGASGFGFLGDGEEATGTGHARKLTGSYYTPDSLVQALLDTALEPVVNRALQAANPEEALLNLTVLDPACGSGHFLLGAARRLAAHLARLRSDGTPGQREYRAALREVMARCIHGVDKNPMAVELARIALWLEAMEPGKPLAFLDHHLVHGDAILGVLDPAVLEGGIPDAAFRPLTGDDKKAAGDLRKENAAQRKAIEKDRKAGQYDMSFDSSAWAERLAAVNAMPDGTLEEIEAKREALQEAWAQEGDGFRFACDAYVAAFLIPKHSGAPVPTTGTLRNLAQGVALPETVRHEVRRVAESVPFLHWPITFAPVMARGGFDCVVGNPPWEKLKLQEKEFFESRAPEIAAAQNKSRRQTLIEELGRASAGSAERRLFDRFEAAKQEAEGASVFAHESGRFPLTGVGDVNLYALFAETGLRLRRNEGRAGMVLPSGIASDAGTAPFFRHVAEGRLVSLVDFENREALFQGVHRSYKFCLLTIGVAEEPSFAFFLTRPEQRFDERRLFTLTAEDLRRLNPNTGTAPIFRSRADAELTAKIYRNVPVLWDENGKDGNPWGLSFGTLFHMSNDSDLFETSPGPGLVPLYEAKMIHQYDHRWATYTGGDEDAVRDVTGEEKRDPAFRVRPRYWVPAAEVEERLQAKEWDRPWLLGWRDITNATNERTVIATVFPRVGVGNTLPLIFPDSKLSPSRIACLVANMSALVADYVARLKVGGTHLNFYLMKQLAILPPGAFSTEEELAIACRVGELCYSTDELQGFAQALNVAGKPSRTVPAERRAQLIAELDALYAAKYGLTRDELRYILDPCDVHGADYPSVTFPGLRENDIARYGEYRTRRLVLEAWDRLIGTR